MSRKPSAMKSLRIALIVLAVLVLSIGVAVLYTGVKAKALYRDIDTEEVVKSAMQFDSYGNSENPTLLLLHGMFMDGTMMREQALRLSDSYYVVTPTFHSMEGAQETVFGTFDSECEYIEEFVDEYLGGHLDFAYGISMGATALYHLMRRGKISIRKAVLDGLYTANQGMIAAYMTSTNYHKFHEQTLMGQDFDLGIMKIGFKLMGMTEDDAKSMFRNEMTRNHMTLKNMSRVAYANYTYKVGNDDFIKDTDVFLWRGSKEPYAMKSNNMVKSHISSVQEEVFDGYGHGELVMKHKLEWDEKIRAAFPLS